MSEQPADEVEQPVSEQPADKVEQAAVRRLQVYFQ